MKIFIPVLLVLWAMGLTGRVAAADAALEAVRTADDVRIAAVIAGDTNKVAALLSEELSYGHSDGRVQTKAEFVQAITSSKAKYEAVTYRDRKTIPAGHGAVAIVGQLQMKGQVEGKPFAMTLRILSVWRDEAGSWRMVAYQSARIPESAPAKKPQ